MIIRSCLLFFALCIASFLPGQQILQLDGHLDKEKIEENRKKLLELPFDDQPIVLLINSTSGEINEVIRLAQAIYETKVIKGKQVVVYIDTNAIGPSAILPFVADKIDTSSFLSWGDIPLGSEDIVPTNVLRNRVLSLLSGTHPRSELFDLLARAMVDKKLVVYDDGGWKGTADYQGEGRVISPADETLVVNRQQLEDLGIVSKVLTKEEFLSQFAIPEETKESIIEEKDASTLEGRLKKHILYSTEGENIVGHILIGDHSQAINQATWLYVKNALDYYKKKKAIFIILELNTPGGEVFSAQKISDALKEMDTDNNIPIVAVIDDWAISAGAMLAYSTRFITTVQGGSMGAAEPVLQTSEGLQSASEKINSAIRADFANRASFYGRSPYIAEAMVDKDAIVVMRYGRIIKLEDSSQIRRGGPNPDIVISAEGKLLTLNSKQMIDYGVADILLTSAKLDPITSQEREKGSWPAAKTLLFHQPFFKDIPNARIDSYQKDWKEIFFSILANPIVSSMLIMGLLMGFYIEINTPGFGIPGSIAVACLGFILLSSFALEAIDWLEVIILLVGIVLIAVDLFLIPSFGIIGGLGILLALGGLFAIMIPGIGEIDYDFDTQTFNAAGQFVLERFAWLSLGFLLGIVGIALMAKYVFPKLAPYSHLVLAGSEQEGYRASDTESLPQAGARGEVLGLLRPGGKVLIDGKVYDAISEGEFIEKGKKIRVIRIDGNVLVVEREAE